MGININLIKFKKIYIYTGSLPRPPRSKLFFTRCSTSWWVCNPLLLWELGRNDHHIVWVSGDVAVFEGLLLIAVFEDLHLLAIFKVPSCPWVLGM